MDKFLNFSFKFGKVFTSVCLVILLLLTVSSIIWFSTQFKKIPLAQASYTQDLQTYSVTNNEQSKDFNGTYKKHYLNVLDAIVKEVGLSEYGKETTLKEIEKVDVEQRDEYADGLKVYLLEFSEYAKMKKYAKDSNKWSIEYINALENYNVSYILNKSEQNTKESKQKLYRIISISTFAVTLLLFILCLIIPLLIKIEENTRK